MIEEESLPNEYIGLSKDQLLRVIREAQEMGVPMDLPPKFNKMTKERILDVVRETYGQEMDEVMRSSRSRPGPGGRLRISSQAIKGAFKSIADRMSSYRRGGRVVSTSGAF